MRLAAITLVLVAAAALAACRARLPVERLPENPAPMAAAPTGLAPFLRGEASLERPAEDPTRPFLAEIQPDRLRDLVRLPWRPDGEGRLFGFHVGIGPACVPHHHR